MENQAKEMIEQNPSIMPEQNKIYLLQKMFFADSS